MKCEYNLICPYECENNLRCGHLLEIRGNFGNYSQQDNAEGKGNTSPSLPPRKKDESLEGGCNENSLAPADTLLNQYRYSL